MTTKERIEQIVDELPHDGEWWKESGRDTYIKVAKKLHKNKVGIRLIEEVLSDLYYAAASEFGN